MSRKWERMVEKNKAELNERRKKQGLGEVTKAGSEQIFKGRGYMLPIFLILVASLYAFININAGTTNTLFWITISLYVLLSLYFFFIRRPYIKFVGNEMVTRRLGRERFAKLADIKKITHNRGTVIIAINGEKADWFFSKGMQLFDTKQLGHHLETIATKRNIPFERT